MCKVPAEQTIVNIVGMHRMGHVSVRVRQLSGSAPRLAAEAVEALGNACGGGGCPGFGSVVEPFHEAAGCLATKVAAIAKV